MRLYTDVLRPALFALDAEQAHELTLGALRLPGARPLLAALHGRSPTPLLQQTLFGLPFENPVGLAAGLDKQGTAAGAWEALGFGFAEFGTVTPRPQPGNPRPRLFRLPGDQAIVNRFGFNSAGAHRVATNLRARPNSIRIGINIGKNKETPNEAAADDYVAACEALAPVAEYFVVNVSSPNTAGLRALQDRQMLRRLVERVVFAARGRASSPIPVLVKVSPDSTTPELIDAVDAAAEGGAAGVVATNTTLARPNLRSPAAGETGGLSGAPLRPMAHEACRILFRHLRGGMPVIGVGGIFTADDAYARVRAGASLIQLYTALIYEGPSVVRTIAEGLVARMEIDGFRSIRDVIGIDAR